MSQEVVNLVLGLAVIVMVLVLGLAFIRFGRGTLEAVLSVFGVSLQLKITNEKKEEAGRHLEEAMQQKGETEGLGDARAPLDEISRLTIRNILWVDDRPNSNTNESYMLEGLGVKIAHFRDTDSALEQLERRRYDLVITDMTREGDDDAGFKLIDEMRLRGQKQPVVIYAAYSGYDRPERSRERGVEFTTRPDRLLQAVLKAGRPS